MSKSLKLILVLTCTTILSGFVLSGVNLLTQPEIEAHQEEVLKEAVNKVLPNIYSYTEKTIADKTLYIGKDLQGNPQNVAFKAIGNGYQSKITILIGMDLNMDRILAIKILQQMETPGLGTKIANDPTSEDPKWFTRQFKKLPAGEPISLVKKQAAEKSEGEVQAITGATISSQSVVDIVNKAIQAHRDVFLSR